MQVLRETEIISAYLLNGGSNDMGVDGSSTPVSFTYTPPGGKQLIAGRIMLYLEATGAGFDSGLFANLTALANGVQVLVNGVEIENWKDNLDIMLTFYDADGRAAFAKLTNSIAGRWTFYKATGGSKGLLINDGGSLEAKVRDNLSVAGLTLRIKVQGSLSDV